MLFSKALELARKHQLDAPNTPIDHLAQQLGMDIETLPQNDVRVCELVRVQDRPAGTYQVWVNANLEPTDRDLAVAMAIAHALMHPHLVGDHLAWGTDGDSGLDAEEDWYARNMAHRLLGRKQQDSADPPLIVLALRHYRMYPPAHATSPEASSGADTTEKAERVSA